MKSLKLLFVMAALGLASIGSAWADRGHGSHDWGHGQGWGHGYFGIAIDPWAPWYYPPIYYPPAYYPQTVVIQPSPSVYIEQPDPAPAPAEQANYWYYCGKSKTYYPYVKACPSGWQRVTPQPPPPQ
ncbi:hypothetical protein [Rugosibacter aromaticivorans]|nr:hypothetical protein [Rugosibacter aromaticivorans]TBR15531.1 MAG: hypothetical protein EPO43_03395 [Rugosibacter sp.]